jgi:thiol-disulfide isomerase/thioredoxin
MVTLRKATSWTIACAALALALPAGPAIAQVAPGSAFPMLAGASLSGPLPDTAGKVVLVDFWASWCAPCKASFPAYSRIQTEYAGRGLAIVAVSVDDNTGDYAAFVAKYRPLFPTVHDSQHRLVAAVQVPTMPTSYLLDRTGKVRFMHPGFHGDSTEKQLRSEIETLLAEKPPAP